ncbi:NADP-dependent oxidoreductase [Chloroflexia bacterium SDU3-3]|nr:NADP-dependent oxidoreductase [Chloroflexia bacterium SDU3-3]
MRAIALDRFGGIEAMRLQNLPVPAIAPNEVLVRVDVAGVGEWDAFEREGGYAEMLGFTPPFPYVLGSEGAGTVAALGADVSHLRVGDSVYALGFLNPKGGFYAEYAAVDAACVSPVPSGLSTAQAAAVGGVGVTALRGLEDTLGLGQGESVMIFGASGGVGHVAVQLAKRLGARVLAVASGADGVALARRLGADAALDGRRDDVLAAARQFAPQGLDAALFAAGGEAAQRALGALREGGRVAYPSGVPIEAHAHPSLRVSSYNGEPDADIIQRLNRLIEVEPFDLHVAQTFPLAQAAEAHRALASHYLGKLVLQVA